MAKGVHGKKLRMSVVSLILSQVLHQSTYKDQQGATTVSAYRQLIKTMYTPFFNPHHEAFRSSTI